MAEFAVVGVAASILQIVDFGMRFVATAWQVSQPERVFLKSLEDLQDSSDLFQDAQNTLQSTCLASNTAINSLARKSVTISKEMTDTLDKIHQERNSLRKAWSALWKQERLKVLEARLREVRLDLAFYMTIELRSAIRDSTEKQDQMLRELHDARSRNESPGLHDSKKKEIREEMSEEMSEEISANYSKLGYGGAIVKHLADGLQLHDKIKSDLINDLIANIYDSEERGSDIPDASHIQLSDKRRSKLEQLIITRLCYDTMKERELTIKNAHKDTFHWILEDNDTTGFRNWLVSGEPLYWITGKPGSGKSTLMRYLLQPVTESGDSNTASTTVSTNPESAAYRYARCAQYLKQWAGSEHNLTIISFHFWAAGSELQNSQEGLYRTLLVQLLQAHPEVIPTVAPLRWEFLCLFNIDPQNFNQIDLGDMFQRAVVQISARSKLAIFIDGLDEFEGNCHTLISLIKSCVASPIKVCVSSRPWNEFEGAFGDCPMLEMQDLTRKDISNYVSSKFEADVLFKRLKRRQPHVAAELLVSIVKKSSGVFLWVTIVVTSLLAGIEAGDRVEDLQETLDQLPEEIELLYERILESVDSRYREHTAQILQLMSAFKTPPSPLLFWYADEVNFMDRAFKENALKVSPEEALDRVEDTRRRLNSRCKGLLEIHGSPTPSTDPSSPRFGGHVDYLHKTVYEFVSSPVTQRRLQGYLRTSYDAHLRIAAAYARLTKNMIYWTGIPNTELWTGAPNKDSQERLSSNLMWCLRYAADASQDSRHEVVRLLDHLTCVCRDVPPAIWRLVNDGRPLVNQTPATDTWVDHFVSLDGTGALDRHQKMLCLATSMSVVEYVKAKAKLGGLIITNRPTHPSPRSGLFDLVGRAHEKWLGNQEISLLSLICLSNPNSVSIIKDLFDKGAKPNTRFTMTNCQSARIRLTPWEEILAEALRYCVAYQEENENKENVMRCVRQMVGGGAKVNLKTIKTASKHARVRIDEEEVYRCLERMKADPDAQFEVFNGSYFAEAV